MFRLMFRLITRRWNEVFKRSYKTTLPNEAKVNNLVLWIVDTQFTMPITYSYIGVAYLCASCTGSPRMGVVCTIDSGPGYPMTV